MRARVDYAIHVEVKVVKFVIIRIRLCGVDRYFLPIDLPRLLFDDWGNDLGVFLGQPSKKRWNTHDGDVLRDSRTRYARPFMKTEWLAENSVVKVKVVDWTFVENERGYDQDGVA